ncbi:hypothetical protein [Natrinema longum]|nr:hypothetical protein [Natrinema longum]
METFDETFAGIKRRMIVPESAGGSSDLASHDRTVVINLLLP